MILLINSALHRLILSMFTICLDAKVTITIHLSLNFTIQISKSDIPLIALFLINLHIWQTLNLYIHSIHVCCDTVSYQCHCSVQDYRLYEALLQFNSRWRGHSMLSSAKMENINRNMHINL